MAESILVYKKMFGFSNKKIVVTHNGGFHADDVFAVATLSLLFDGKIKVIRTRDEGIFLKGDYVVDVGGIYDPEKDRFDHHQKGGAGMRENTVPYASFGLVWKKFGEQVCQNKIVAEKIEKNLVWATDAFDNGVASPKSVYSTDTYSYDVGLFLKSFNPSWKEKADYDVRFLEAVEEAKKVLRRLIILGRHGCEAESLVKEAYERATDKRIVIFEKDMPWQETLVTFPEPIFVVAPRVGSDMWAIRAIRKNLTSFENRKDLPRSWAGLSGAVLVEISGVPDALMCHNACFVANAKSREGAIALANKALNE